MFKGVIIFILGMMLWQGVKAQKKPDTLIYAMNNIGQLAVSSKAADYFLFILPPDNSSGVVLYPIQEYYASGKPKLSTSSSTNDYKALKFEGPAISYFPDGRKESIDNYSNGALNGLSTSYYPNSKLYSNLIVGKGGNSYLIECRDSTGNVLTENGNGTWITYDQNLKNVFQQGPVKDSLAEGEWTENIDDKIKYTTIYHKGKIVSTKSPYRSKGELLFSGIERQPSYKRDGEQGFLAYLSQNITYPSEDKQNNVHGRVIVQFVVEKDGSITNVKAIRGPDQSLMDEAERVIKLSPKWNPGIQNGRPVRVQYTVPINFGL